MHPPKACGLIPIDYTYYCAVNQFFLFKQVVREIKLLCVLALAINTLFAQEALLVPNEKVYKKHQLQTDYEVLYHTLTQYHPAPFLYTSKEAFLDHYNHTHAHFPDSLTHREFMLSILQLTALLRCGHSSMAFPDSWIDSVAGKPFLLPFDIRVVEGKVVVFSTIADTLDFKPGDELLAVNGVSAASILEQMYAIQNRDGLTNAFANELIGRRFRLYYLLINGYETEFEISFQSAAGVLSSTKVAATNKRLPALKPLEMPEGFFMALTNDWSTLAIDTNLNRAYLKIRTFGARKGYKKHYAKVFKILEAYPEMQLWIDLRGNTGGYFYNGNHLLSYFHTQEFNFTFRRPIAPWKKNQHARFGLLNRLTIMAFSLKPDNVKAPGYRTTTFTFKPQKTPFKGPVAVITNCTTFSQAAIFAAEMHQLGAPIYGSETGGTEHVTNGLAKAVVVLPNSKLAVTVAYYQVVSNSKKGQLGHGVKPTAAPLPF